MLGAPSQPHQVHRAQAEVRSAGRDSRSHPRFIVRVQVALYARPRGPAVSYITEPETAE